MCASSAIEFQHCYVLNNFSPVWSEHGNEWTILAFGDQPSREHVLLLPIYSIMAILQEVFFF